MFVTRHQDIFQLLVTTEPARTRSFPDPNRAAFVVKEPVVLIETSGHFQDVCGYETGYF